MDGPRAIGGPSGGFHGKPVEDLDLGGVEIPSHGENKLTSWIGRFAGVNQRRGSVGFSDNLSVPLSRMDDDSNSGIGDCSGASTEKRDSIMSIPFGRKRDLSFSDLQTPGGDGDTFVHMYRRRRLSEDYGTEQPEIPEINLLNFKDSGILMEQESHISINKEGSAGIKPVTLEGLNLDLSQTKEHGRSQGTSDTLTASHYGVGVQGASGKTEESPSIFLIDLEPTEDGSKLKLKPQSKKFSAAQLFQSNWAQNWFFRNGDAEEGEKTNGMEVEESRKLSTESMATDRSSSEERDDEPLSFAGKLKKMSGAHPRGLREMNTWQPQGF